MLTKDQIEVLDDRLNAFQQSVKDYEGALALNRRPLPERYIKGEIVIHVHIVFQRGHSGDRTTSIDTEPCDFCLVFEWPQGATPQRLGWHRKRVGRLPFAANHKGPRLSFEGHNRHCAVLVDVREFPEMPEGMRVGRIARLPAVKRLQLLETCLETSRSDTAEATSTPNLLPERGQFGEREHLLARLLTVRLWDDAVGLLIDERFDVPDYTSNVLLCPVQPFPSASERMAQKAEASHAR